MTTFSGPLKVRSADTESTVVDVEASGTASFVNPVTFDAAVRVSAGGRGPGGTGKMTLVQQATILHSNTAGAPVTFNLPSGANLIEYLVAVETPFAAGSMVTAQRVNLNISGSADNPISEVGVSASGVYRLLDANGGTVATNKVRNVTGTIEAFVSTKALASAATVGQGLVTCRYVF